MVRQERAAEQRLEKPPGRAQTLMGETGSFSFFLQAYAFAKAIEVISHLFFHAQPGSLPPGSGGWR